MDQRAGRHCHWGSSKFYQELIGEPSHKDAHAKDTQGYGLLGFAEQEFLLTAKQKDGASLRDHLESVHRRTGVFPDQLKPIEVVPCILYIWSWFCTLNEGRDYGEYGPKPITWKDMEAWAHLTKSEPTVWELDVIRQLDRIFLSEAMRKK